MYNKGLTKQLIEDGLNSNPIDVINYSVRLSDLTIQTKEELKNAKEKGNKEEIILLQND